MVPLNETSFPLILRGKPLGKMVNNMRIKQIEYANKEQSLREENGIQLYTSRSIRIERERFECLCRSLDAYRTKYGNLNVKKRYIIPNNAKEFPSATWGYHLGKAVDNIINQNAWMKGDYKNKLMDYNIFSDKNLSSVLHPVVNNFTMPVNDIIEGIIQFQLLFTNEDINVCRSFIITTDIKDSFPETLHGYDLGEIVQLIKSKAISISKHYKAKLRKIGVTFTTGISS